MAFETCQRDIAVPVWFTGKLLPLKSTRTSKVWTSKNGKVTWISTARSQSVIDSMYLDIETTGLSPTRNQITTIVWWSAEQGWGILDCWRRHF